ncbi:hypothetical protein LINGRAHAP2_LOCUS5194, partial [Linum grandiflorum]
SRSLPRPFPQSKTWIFKFSAQKPQTRRFLPLVSNLCVLGSSLQF